MKERAINLATKHVEDYLFEEGVRAFETLERERTGRGCGCANCAKEAVRKVNELIDMVTDDSEIADKYYYDIDLRNGRMVIITPGERKKQKTYFPNYNEYMGNLP